MPLIELKNVYKRFGKLLVLNHVNLAIEERQSLVILGASGSGKSVLLKHIVGLLKPDHGEVWFDGHRIDHAFRTRSGSHPPAVWIFVSDGRTCSIP